jgi:hypothetical protein
MKREIVKQIARLQSEIAARSLPADVVAELLQRHQAKHYVAADTVPTRSTRVVESVEAVRQNVHADEEKLTRKLLRLQAKLGL